MTKNSINIKNGQHKLFIIHKIINCSLQIVNCKRSFLKETGMISLRMTNDPTQKNYGVTFMTKFDALLNVITISERSTILSPFTSSATYPVVNKTEELYI